MKARAILVGGGVAVVLAAIGLYVAFRLGLFAVGKPPVVVVGGCIRGTFAAGWRNDYPNSNYEGTALRPTLIYTKHVYDNGSLVTQPVTAQNGFVINFYDSEPDGVTPRDKPGVQLCTDKNCSGGPGPGDTVYIRISPDRNDAQFEEFSPNELRFHSLYKGSNGQCDPHASGSDTGKCDRPTKLGIVLDGVNETPYDCGGHSDTHPGQCVIGIGGSPDDPYKH
jgi:hypothetical protein